MLLCTLSTLQHQTGTIFGIFEEKEECLVDDDADLDEARQKCLLNTLQVHYTHTRQTYFEQCMHAVNADVVHNTYTVLMCWGDTSCTDCKPACYSSSSLYVLAAVVLHS
jgi:hypothetical protein